MGKKQGAGGASGNAYKNPIDSYRKQLGRNEEHKTSMAPRSRGSRHRPTSQRELARARRPPKNWKSIMAWSMILLLIVGSVFALVAVEAGKYIHGLMFRDNSAAEHVRVHRDS
jgi:hypothetical protein